ncbi:unnamed protein product, partial [Adineta steineri]
MIVDFIHLFNIVWAIDQLIMYTTAIIGPGDSSITMQTHNILQLFEMPQIGYSATAKQLSNKEKFKYFTRVIASDTQQAQAIVSIIRQFKGNYVA